MGVDWLEPSFSSVHVALPCCLFFHCSFLSSPSSCSLHFPGSTPILLVVVSLINLVLHTATFNMCRTDKVWVRRGLSDRELRSYIPIGKWCLRHAHNSLAIVIGVRLNDLSKVTRLRRGGRENKGFGHGSQPTPKCVLCAPFLFTIFIAAPGVGSSQPLLGASWSWVHLDGFFLVNWSVTIVTATLKARIVGTYFTPTDLVYKHITSFSYNSC